MGRFTSMRLIAVLLLTTFAVANAHSSDKYSIADSSGSHFTSIFFGLSGGGHL